MGEERRYQRKQSIKGKHTSREEGYQTQDMLGRSGSPLPTHVSLSRNLETPNLKGVVTGEQLCSISDLIFVLRICNTKHHEHEHGG